MATVTNEGFSPTESTESTPVRTLLAAFALLVGAALASLAIPTGFSALFAALGREETLLLSTIGGVAATLALGVLAVAYLQVRDVEIPIARPVGREWAWVGGGVAVSLVVAVVFAILEGIVAVDPATTSSSSIAAGASALTVVLAGAYFVLVIGPIEEYLYRGVVQGRLRQSFGPAVAIGVTSVGFAVGHAPNLWLAGSDLLSMGAIVALAGIAVGSIILGAIYERTANLSVVVITHGLFNTVIFGLLVALGA